MSFSKVSPKMWRNSLLFLVLFALKFNVVSSIVGGREVKYIVKESAALAIPELMFQFEGVAVNYPETLDKYPLIIRKYPEYKYNRPQLKELWEQRMKKSGVVDTNFVFMRRISGRGARSAVEAETLLKECQQPKNLILDLCALIPKNELTEEERNRCKDVTSSKELEDALQPLRVEEMKALAEVHEKFQRLFDQLKMEIDANYTRKLKVCEALSDERPQERRREVNAVVKETQQEGKLHLDSQKSDWKEKAFVDQNIIVQSHWEDLWAKEIERLKKEIAQLEKGLLGN